MRGIVAAAVASLAVAVAGCTTATIDEQSLSTAEIRDLVTGKLVNYVGGGRSAFLPDGSYQFSYRGQIAVGRYSFRNNQVCVDFSTGDNRCDRFVKRGQNYYLINANGQRFKARFSNIIKSFS